MQNRYPCFTFIPKAILLLLIFGLAQLSISAQEWQWAKAVGDTASFIQIKKITTIDENRAVVVGEFYGQQVQLGNITLNNNGLCNAFVAITSNSGEYLHAKSFGGSDQTYVVDAVANASGDIYLTGFYRGLEMIADGFSLQNEGNADGFLIKFDSLLQTQWLKSVSSPNDDFLGAATFDNENNVCLAGYSINNSLSPARHVLFFTKYDSGGELLKLSTATNDSGQISAVELNKRDNGAFFLTGNFSGEIKFPNANLNIQQPTTNGFIIDIHPSGDFDTAYAVPFTVEASTSFENDLIVLQKVRCNTLTCGFTLFKFSENLDLIWQNNIERTFDVLNFFGDINVNKSLSTDTAGNIYFASAYYSDVFRFAEDSFVYSRPDSVGFVNYYYSLFLLQHDKNGNEVKARKIDGNINTFYQAIHVTPFGNVILAGDVRSDSTAFGTHVLYNNASPQLGSTFHYAIKYLTRNPLTFLSYFGKDLPVNTFVQERKANFSLYPNPSKDYFLLQSAEFSDAPVVVQIFSLDGKLLQNKLSSPIGNQLRVNTNGLPTGMYIVAVQQNNQISALRFVKY